jgi:hypothetical protein
MHESKTRSLAKFIRALATPSSQKNARLATPSSQKNARLATPSYGSRQLTKN